METGKMKLALSAGALALSMALAGCGGGSSSTATPQPTVAQTPPPPLPPETDLGQLVEDANMALRNATRELDGLAANADPAEAARLFAIAQREVGDAANADGHADRQAQLRVLQTRLTTAQTDFDSDQMAMTGKMHERALGLEQALRGDIAATNVPEPKITRGESGPTSITLKGWTGAPAASAGDGWHGMTLTGDGLLNKDQKLTVYTNIEAAKRKALWGTGGLYTTVNDDVGVDDATTPTHLTLGGETAGTVDTPVTLTKEAAAYLDKSRFPQPGATTPTTYGTGSDDTHERKFPGTFRGASGMYSCTPAENRCSVEAPKANAASTNYNLVGTWIFTPNDGQKGVEMDTSHINFGWWIKEPEEKDSGGDYVYDVKVFHRGVGTARTDDVGALTGTATYMGAAGGVYVSKTGEGDSLAATHGTFTADAELVANFDKTDAVGTATLTGEIGNFKGGSGMDDWSVKLGVMDVTAGDGSSTTNRVTAGKTSGTGTGAWEATFHGGASASAPTSVHGMFDAHSSTVNIVGAFGADIE